MTLISFSKSHHQQNKKKKTKHKMAENEYLGLIMASIALIWLTLVTLTDHRRSRSLPPGPFRFPVVGNIFQLGWPPHVAFAKLARKHGPIMTLWLGSMSTVVISSSEVARDMFKNHDAALAGRKIYEAMKSEEGNEGSIITAQYGPHWRMLRRLCTAEFFVASRIDAMRVVRERCVENLVRFVEKSCGSSGKEAIDVGNFFYLMNFNLIGNLMFSKDLLDPSSERGREFFDHANKVRTI